MRRHGFTLVETMIVVAIIGLLAAMAVPSLLGLTRRAKVSTEATTMTSLFSMMRTQALTRGLPTVVCVRGKLTTGSTPTTLPNMSTSYRKRVPVLPPALIQASTAGLDEFNATAALQDKVIDSHRIEEIVTLDFVSPPLDTKNDKTLQFVYDLNGQVTAFYADACEVAADGSRVQLSSANFPIVLRVRHNFDLPAALPEVFQYIQIRRDGTVALP